MQKNQKFPALPHTKRTLLFKLFSICLPVFILVLLEISLRIFDYGYDFRLFIEYPRDPDYLTLNPNASKRYFNDPAMAPTGNHELFRKIKDKNTCRIFVLGESTTIGYPYFHNGSFHRWLQYRLMRSFPDRNFEIINLSLTAVNSYTVLGFAKELVNYQPDAVLIYSGHNEYYGTLGVGSTSRISGNSFVIQSVLALRQLRIVQLFGNAYRHMVSLMKPVKPGAGETLMQLVVGDQRIPYGSALYQRGVDQFRSNLGQTLDLFNRHHIPVFISSLVSNDLDMKPFVSIPPDSARDAGFGKYYEEGIEACERQDAQMAKTFFTAANQAYSGHALCNYYLGQLFYREKNYREAARYFTRARELDGLRFRAPEQFNQIIRELCNRYPNAHLADSKAIFESNSSNHIIGRELMLEHVHPNLKGYGLISDAFYEAMKKENIFSEQHQPEMSFPELQAGMPITRVDSLTGVYKIMKLKNSWPFNEVFHQDSLIPGSEEQKMAYDIVFRNLHWSEAMERLYSYYIGLGQLSSAKVVMETLVLEHPEQTTYYERAANVCGKMNDLENAAFYFKKAFELSPDFERARFLLVIYLELDRPGDAMPYIDYAIDNNASGSRMIPIKQYAGEIVQLKQALLKDSADTATMDAIAAKYFSMGNRVGAIKYLDKVLKLDPSNASALALMSRAGKAE